MRGRHSRGKQDLVTALLLGLAFSRGDRAGRVVGAAAIAGLVAMILDIFVL